MSNSASSTNDPSNEVTKSDDVETSGKNNTRNITTQKNDKTTTAAPIQLILLITFLVIEIICAIVYSVYSFKKADGKNCFFTLKVCSLCNAVIVIVMLILICKFEYFQGIKQVPVYCILLVKKEIPKQYITYWNRADVNLHVENETTPHIACKNDNHYIIERLLGKKTDEGNSSTNDKIHNNQIRFLKEKREIVHLYKTRGWR